MKIKTGVNRKELRTPNKGDIVIIKNAKHETLQLGIVIDRVDSDRGYTKENSVTCCKYCNFAKHTMSEDDFYKWIRKVYEFNFK